MLLSIFFVAAITACIRKSIYPGSRLSPSQAAASLVAEGWTLESVPVGGEHLIGVERPPRGRSARWILFFGGNGSSIVMNAHALAAVAGSSDLGLATYAYRGYDGSTGTPSEPAIESDARALARHLAEAHGVSPDRLILAGHSLGTGVASSLDAALAGEGTPAVRLLLVSPFLSISAVVSDLVPCGGCLVRDRWPTAKRAPALTGPILILHGSEDEVIGVHHGQDLARLLGPKATFVLVPGRHHNDIFDDAAAIKAMHAFVDAR